MNLQTANLLEQAQLAHAAANWTLLLQCLQQLMSDRRQETKDKSNSQFTIDANATLRVSRRRSEALHNSQLSHTPLLVGGTGLYIRSIVRGMKIPRVAPQPELRSQLLSLGQKQLSAILQQVDPIAATKIHPNDPIRTIRALEVFYVTGRPISAQQGENPPSYPILQIGLDCESNALTQRISQRTEQMIADGLVAEVEYLCQKYSIDLPLLNTLGYQEFKQYLAGDISLEEAKKLTVLHTRQFAKRQRTWFRAYPEIQWFDAESPDLVERVWQRIQDFITQLNLKENERF